MTDSLSPDTLTKIAKLRALLKSYGSVLVAFSGGVDSSFLSKIAHDVLGDKALAVTAKSETYPQWEYEEAVALAAQIGIRHLSIETSELGIEGFSGNPPDRCYHCKRELFGKLQAVAKEQGVARLLEGANADDVGDFRPGMRATAELGVASPLKEVGLTKDEIRQASRAMGLPTWDKPSYACLASRFPYGEEITKQGLNRVGSAEEFLRGLGLSQLRVRHHGDVARIEVPPEDISKIAAPASRAKIVARFKELGYRYVTLDLQGYRMGSMNETLDARTKDKATAL